MRFLLVAGAAAALLAGCALFSRPFEEPEIKVRGLGIERASLAGIEAVLALDIFNPNEYGVPLEGGSLQLSIGGSRAVTVTFDLAETIPARASAPIETSIFIGSADAARVGRRLASGQRDYELAGELSFATRLGSVAVGYTHRGQLEDLARHVRDHAR
jgi:hypothetical protein